MWAVLRLRNSCGHATLPRSILPSRSKLHARARKGKRERERSVQSSMTSLSCWLASRADWEEVVVVRYLARENSGKELKEPNEALCRNEADGSGISLSRSVENDICTRIHSLVRQLHARGVLRCRRTLGNV